MVSNDKGSGVDILFECNSCACIVCVACGNILKQGVIKMDKTDEFLMKLCDTCRNRCKCLITSEFTDNLDFECLIENINKKGIK